MKNFITYDLAKKFHKECRGLKLIQPYKDQFDRALLSVVLNIAEGSAKPTKKDRTRFYSIALGSLREVQAILDLLGHENLLKAADPLAGCLYRLSQNPGGI